jgi:hypothetical protein
VRTIRLLWLVGGLAAACVGVGCDDGDGCDAICAKQEACQDDAPDAATCIDICRELVDGDADFAEAVDEQADCYEDATCEEIAGGRCRYDAS